MRATVILRSIGHECFPKKKKKRSSPVVRVIDLSIISHSLASKNSKRAADGRKKSHMRLRSRGLLTSGLGCKQNIQHIAMHFKFLGKSSGCARSLVVFSTQFPLKKWYF